MVIQLTVCRGRQNKCTECCSLQILAKTQSGSIRFWDCVFNHILCLSQYILKRSASKDNPWNEVSLFQLELKSVLFPQSCGMLQAKFKSVMEPKSDVAKSSYKTSRNHRSFRKCFYYFISVQSSPSVLPLHQIYPCCLWISCHASHWLCITERQHFEKVCVWILQLMFVWLVGIYILIWRICDYIKCVRRDLRGASCRAKSFFFSIWFMLQHF